MTRMGRKNQFLHAPHSRHWRNSRVNNPFSRLFIPVFLSGPVIVLATNLRAHPLRSGVFLAGLFWRLDSYFFRVFLSFYCSSSWQVLRHEYLPLSHWKYYCTRGFDIDVDIFFRLNASAENHVEAEYRQQDNDHNGYGSHTTTRVVSHLESPPL